MLIPFTTGLWNNFEATLCFIKPQLDPDQQSWVIPYPKEIRCTQCTQFAYNPCPVNFCNSLCKDEGYFYTDEPSLFVNSESQDKLQMLFGCNEDAGRFKFSKFLHIKRFDLVQTMLASTIEHPF